MSKLDSKYFLSLNLDLEIASESEKGCSPECISGMRQVCNYHFLSGTLCEGVAVAKIVHFDVLDPVSVLLIDVDVEAIRAGV